MALQGVTMPPPYGGLDVVSPIDQMDPNYALELINIFPGANAPTVRLGYTRFNSTALDSGNPVKFVTQYIKTDGTTRLVAATDTKIFSITPTATVTDVTPVTAPTSGEYQSVTYAGNLYLCNGVDSARSFNGTTVANLTFTGVTLSNLIGVTAHKERLYFIEKDTAKVWYGGLQVTGTGGTPALTAFDLQYVFTRGGKLVGIGSFSQTTSASSQDYFYACSSEGEIVFYTGTYAGDPNTWGLVAKYYIGRPLGYRAFIRINNDTWILTKQGIVPISALFQSDPEAALNTVSQKVNPIISTAASAIPFDHQWSGFFWPQGRRVYISIPYNATSSYFLVYALDTKGWTIFQLYSNYHSLSSCLFDELPFYGGDDGFIWKGETGQCDAFYSSGGTDFGEAIRYEGRTAFSFYNSRGNYKAFKDIRPLLEAKRGLQMNLGLDIDFKRADTIPSITTGTGNFTSWSIPGSTPGTPGYVPWGSLWSSSNQYIFDRFATKGQGHCAAIRFSGTVKNSTLKLLGFEIRFDLGGQV